LAQRDAPRIQDSLLVGPWALPLQLATATAALTALAALWYRRWAVARFAAAAQVSCILWGWALGQYPAIIPPDLTIAAAAAPSATLRAVLVALLLGAMVVLPALGYLFRVFKGGERGA
jgi:cytochrome bd ubiquinol oxidase subunit II